VGRNSSGKSTLIQILLLLKQSAEERAVGSRLPQLNLNGPLLDAGTYEEFIHDHDSNQELTISFCCQLESEKSTRGLAMSDGLVRLDIPRPPKPIFRPYYVGDKAPRFPKTGKLSTTISLSFLPEPPFGPTLRRFTVQLENDTSVTFVRTSGAERVQHWRGYFSNLPSKSLTIVFPPYSFFPALMPRRSVYNDSPPVIKGQINQFVQMSHQITNQLQEFLLNSRFLGPFRTPPSRRYVFTGFGALDAGPTGERAVDLLITEKLVRADYPELRKAVVFWLRRLGLAKNLKVRALSARTNIFELSLSRAGYAASANFADVGFGISQVLPVLVQGLFTPRGGVYIVQQPELHLHPDAQAALADFFLYLASLGVNSIVETHSEYFLLRLRRRLAEGIKNIHIGLATEKKARFSSIGRDQISVVCVTESEVGSYFLPLEIGASFQFENMPDNFMTQSMDDRMALMKALSKS
jgi:hypothetical protein